MQAGRICFFGCSYMLSLLNQADNGKSNPRQVTIELESERNRVKDTGERKGSYISEWEIAEHLPSLNWVNVSGSQSVCSPLKYSTQPATWPWAHIATATEATSGRPTNGFPILHSQPIFLKLGPTGEQPSTVTQRDWKQSFKKGGNNNLCWHYLLETQRSWKIIPKDTIWSPLWTNWSKAVGQTILPPLLFIVLFSLELQSARCTRAPLLIHPAPPPPPRLVATSLDEVEELTTLHFGVRLRRMRSLSSSCI